MKQVLFALLRMCFDANPRSASDHPWR